MTGGGGGEQGHGTDERKMTQPEGRGRSKARPGFLGPEPKLEPRNLIGGRGDTKGVGGQRRLLKPVRLVSSKREKQSKPGRIGKEMV